MIKQALLIFYKNPEAGQVKTRLAATIGNEAALTVYHHLIEHTASITKRLPVDKIVFYAEQVRQEDRWDSNIYSKQLQTGKDLGERMGNAFAAVFERAYDKAVIIGTDCPELTQEFIMDGFTVLDEYDIVIGPAKDGGYYLLGMKKLYLELFENIAWSTNTVLNETIRKCAEKGLRYLLLPLLSDIDEEKDWQAYKLQQQ